MAAHNEKGKEAEALAADYFVSLKFEVLHKNWRYRHWEVDLIATRNGMLHFIEVKSRSTDRYGHPEENVSLKKIKNLIDASVEYLYRYPQWQRIQFDVLSITFKTAAPPDFFLIQDVYL